MNKTVLNNGLTIITDTNKSLNVATLCYMIKVGSYGEIGFNTGIAHLTEHMLFKGTTSRTAKQIALDSDRIGCYKNADTDFEKTRYYCTVPSENIKDAFDILTEMVFNSTIPEEELQKEKNVVKEEINMDLDNPHDFVQWKIFEIMHKNNPHRRSVIGTHQSVDSITRLGVMSFLEKYYVPENMVLMAVGNIEHEYIVEWASNFLRDKKFLKYVESRPALKEEVLNYETYKIYREIEQINLSWGIHITGTAKDVYYIVRLIDIILSGGYSSRLVDVVREQLGLAYDIYTDYQMIADNMIMYGVAGLNNNSKYNIKEIIWNEYEKLANDFLSEDELDKAKNYLYGSILRSDVYPEDKCTQLSLKLIAGLPIEDNPRDMIWKISACDINKFAKKYFRKDNICFVELSK